jgi:hypothetical protein
MTMKSILLFLVLAVFQIPMQGQTLSIEIRGKIYTVKGSNLTILIGKNPIVNVQKEVPKHIRDSIKQRYQGKINSLERRYKKGEINLTEKESQRRIYDAELSTAIAFAEKLAIEFSQTDFSQQSYLYRLAYIFYDEGNIEAAQAILSDERLEQHENCHAVLYLLSAAALWANNSNTLAVRQLETVYKKYPSLLTCQTLADHLFLSGEFSRAADVYRQANNFTTPLKRRFFNIQAAYCYYLEEKPDLALTMFNQNIDMIGSSEALLQDSINGCYLAPPSNALSSAYISAQSELLNTVLKITPPDLSSVSVKKGLNLLHNSPPNPVSENTYAVVAWHLLTIQYMIAQKNNAGVLEFWQQLKTFALPSDFSDRIKKMID